jgi:acetoacetate decarboxylase
MVGQQWLSLFRVTGSGRPDRPAGMYGVAFVDYAEGSVLTYHELLVARLLRDGDDKHVTVTDIWVDSEKSMQGGRALWGVPKELAKFDTSIGGIGPVHRTEWSAHDDAQPIASAKFIDVPRAGLVRLPFKGTTWQEHENGGAITATLSGTAKNVLALGSWDFAADGPLGWLHGRRPLLTVRMVDFTMHFG